MRNNDTGMSGHREPTLTATQSAHALRVRTHIADRIAAAGGWLSFENYMDLALYAPGLGYYSAGARKFGGEGDFTTAPEISALFGACVARQCAQILAALGGGDLLEIGAGSGRLAVDLLSQLERSGRLPRRYLILESSADLRERQQRLLESELPHLGARIAWLDAPPRDAFRGAILANEVLDALPVARFRQRGGRFEELGVAVVNGEFVQAPRPAGAALAAYCGRMAAAGSWPEGYESECCPRMAAFTQAVTAPLESGAVLWFDYGLPRAQYYLPDRAEGTLMCHFRHQAHADPLRLPGLEDITAWVDFTALAECAALAGFEVAGFTTQTYFLAGLGVDEEMHAMANDDPRAFARLANQARRLMMPGEMGERFKAMAWTRGVLPALGGFRLRDLRHVL